VETTHRRAVGERTTWNTSGDSSGERSLPPGSYRASPRVGSHIPTKSASRDASRRGQQHETNSTPPRRPARRTRLQLLRRLEIAMQPRRSLETTRSKTLGVIIGLSLTGMLLARCSSAERAAHASAEHEVTDLRKVEAVASLMLERLETADIVAASKWATKVAGDDPARERVVIDTARDETQKQGADPVTVQRIMTAQIQANKTVQQGLLDHWKNSPADAPTTTPDLTVEVRPKLDRIDTELVAAIKTAQPVLTNTRCGSIATHVLESADIGLDSLHQRALSIAIGSLCGPAR
jgi:chorismate mutase